MVREAEHAESKPDFIHKKAIAQKEMSEPRYSSEPYPNGDVKIIH
jgi:hypothetical protein